MTSIIISDNQQSLQDAISFIDNIFNDLSVSESLDLSEWDEWKNWYFERRTKFIQNQSSHSTFYHQLRSVKKYLLSIDYPQEKLFILEIDDVDPSTVRKVKKAVSYEERKPIVRQTKRFERRRSSSLELIQEVDSFDEEELKIRTQEMEEFINNYPEGMRNLEEALTNLHIASGHLRKASTLSYLDCCSGGSFCSVAKLNSIQSAQADLRIVSHKIKHFKKLLPGFSVTSGHVEGVSMFWEVVIDNYFTDIDTIGKVKRSRESVKNAMKSLEDTIKKVEERKVIIEQRLEEAKARLQELNE